MSDDDQGAALDEGSTEDDEQHAPRTRDLAAELRERSGVDADGVADVSDVDSETATAFWGAVIYVNAGILLIALGPTLYAIRGMPVISAALVVVGCVLLYRAYSVYRAFEARDDDTGGEGDSSSVDDGSLERDGDSSSGGADTSKADDGSSNADEPSSDDSNP